MANTIDTVKLAQYLESKVKGFHGLLATEKFAGGQSNPTFLLTAQSGKYVLRRKPPGQLLASAHAVDREFKVIKSLAATKVPVPRALHLCEDDSVIGSIFYVMSYENGHIFWDPALPELQNKQRSEIYCEMINKLAVMHNIDVKAVGLGDYGKPGNYYERQIGRWSKQYRAAETETIDEMEKLLSWLPANLPVDDGQISLIHGDYRLDNVIFSLDKSKIIAVLDWELSTLGHPLADLAYYCMCLRLPRHGPINGLIGIDRHTQGIPSELQIINQYCELRGIEGIDNWNFYLAFSFFRLASICQGVFKRAVDGNASNEKAMATEKLARSLSKMAVKIIEH